MIGSRCYGLDEFVRRANQLMTSFLLAMINHVSQQLAGFKQWPAADWDMMKWAWTTTPCQHNAASSCGAYGQLPGREFTPLDLSLLLRTIRSHLLPAI